MRVSTYGSDAIWAQRSLPAPALELPLGLQPRAPGSSPGHDGIVVGQLSHSTPLSAYLHGLIAYARAPLKLSPKAPICEALCALGNEAHLLN